ncbi:MAG: hypothetical protein Q7U16_10240 [Agitococcus sp.]|nr:hypothetical protein [Agitococcus sp.]
MEPDYIIGSSVELGELTPLEAMALTYLKDGQRAIEEMLTSKDATSSHFLPNMARLALSRANESERHFVALASLAEMPGILKFAMERAEYLVQKKVQQDLGIVDTSNVWSALRAKTTDTDQEVADTIVTPTEQDITESAVKTILAKQMGSYMQRLEDNVQAIQKALTWKQQNKARVLQTVQSQSLRIHQSRETFAQSLRDKKASTLQRSKQKRARSAIKKVCKLFSMFQQERSLTLFVSGKEVELAHPASNFKFILRPLDTAGWLEDRSSMGRTHTPYDLSLFTKSNVFVAKLCVYFDSTPVLDQLLALALFIQAGDEQCLLEKANFYAVNYAATEAGFQFVTQYPSLKHKLPQRLLYPEAHAADTEPNKVKQSLKEIIQRQVGPGEEHWEPIKGRVAAWVRTWFSPITELPILQLASGGTKQAPQPNLALPRLLVTELSLAI